MKYTNYCKRTVLSVEHDNELKINTFMFFLKSASDYFV